MEGDRLKVAVRVRPPLALELGKEEVVYVEGNSIKVSDDQHLIESSFDKVFTPNVQQAEVYEFIAPVVHNVVKGFNASIFAYGQTGSGKTYTMFGSEWEQNVGRRRGPHSLDNPVSHGVIPRAVQQLFQDLAVDMDRGHSFTVLCSFVQIYNERVFDLLQDDSHSQPLSIREDALFGIFVEGLAEYVVQTPTDCLLLIKRGDRNRAIRATKMNAMSSRSHSIFQLKLEGEKANKKGMLKRAKLNLCDLAGSEKFDKEGEMTKPHIVEMGSINTSLTTLGKVVSLLSTPGSTHIPYRDSKLTRLLQDSLGGNTSTCFLVTVSPIVDSIDETISTLKFADRAKRVLVRVKKNAISATNDRLVVKLQREIQHLKDVLQLRKQGAGGLAEIQQRLWSLTMENQKLREMNQGLSAQEVERLIMENKNMKVELQKLYDQVANAGSIPADTPRRSFGEGELASVSTATCLQCHQQLPCNCPFSLRTTSPVNPSQPSQSASVIEEYPDTRSHRSFDPIAVRDSPSRASGQNATTRTEYGGTARSITNRQVEVRIRGRGNAVVTTTAPLEKSLEQEVMWQQRKKELRRAQQRLKTLEKIDQFREQKAQEQIIKLQEDHQRREALLQEREQAQYRNRGKLEDQRKRLQQYADIKLQRKEVMDQLAREAQEAEKRRWRQRASGSKPRAVSLRPRFDKIDQLLQS